MYIAEFIFTLIFGLAGMKLWIGASHSRPVAARPSACQIPQKGPGKRWVASLKEGMEEWLAGR